MCSRDRFSFALLHLHFFPPPRKTKQKLKATVKSSIKCINSLNVLFPYIAYGCVEQKKNKKKTTNIHSYASITINPHLVKELI